MFVFSSKYEKRIFNIVYFELKLFFRFISASFAVTGKLKVAISINFTISEHYKEHKRIIRVFNRLPLEIRK